MPQKGGPLIDTKQFQRRVLAVVVLMALLLTGLGSVLYDLQINNGETYRRQSQYKIAETETVEAGRGQILDRNGRVLVSDKAVYQVKLNTSLMGKAPQRNQAILSLLQVARATGTEWEDTLPISRQAPFTFTTDNPYYALTDNEDGTQSRTLTRLGKLCVKMKWIQDPTKDPEPVSDEETAPQKQGFFDKLKSIFSGGNSASDQSAPQEKEEDTSLPTAEQLLGRLCLYFDLAKQPEGSQSTALSQLDLGGLGQDQVRDAAGVLYEQLLRTKGVNQTAYRFAADVNIDFISRVKELSIPGVVIEATTTRQYHTTYAAHLLGRVAAIDPDEWTSYYKTADIDGDGEPDYQMNDTVGKEGAERAFENYLRGSSGVRALERNTSGKVVSETWLTDPKPGNNVVLTIDLDLQGTVEDVLANSIPKLSSKEVEGAACVILDVNNGDVLASASYPTFSLATYGQDIAQNSSNPLKPLTNRALTGTYPPGSTFKMVTAIAGLEEGIITPSTKILDKGAYTYYPGTPPKCWIYRQHGTTHGLVNVSEAIKVSCNYFFYDVGRRLGIDRLVDYATRFGLGQKTGIELGEKPGVMASREYTESRGQKWYDGNTLSVAIGQENSAFTPIQLANYIATLVNGGTRYSTHLLKEVKASDFTSVEYSYQPQVLSTIDIQPKNLEAVKAGMLALTSDGSVSRYFQNLGVKVGAKTGSAQISAQTESNAVFVCFAPYDKPEIAMAIVVEHGGSGSELGAMAADILSYYFSAKQTQDEVPTENTLTR